MVNNYVTDCCEGSAPGTQWLALHGWLDNAGSFDTLAPQLVSACPRHALLCLDYPGHGRSSHLPPGQVSAATS